MVSTAIFGSTPALVTFMHGTLNMTSLLAFRGLVAAALLGCLAAVGRFLPSRKAKRQDDVKIRSALQVRFAGLIMGMFLYAPQLLLFYAAFAYLDTSLAVALGYIYPTMVVCIAAVRSRRRPSWIELVLSAVALVGIVALTNPGKGGGSVSLTGCALVFAAALMYAVYVVIAADLVLHQPPLRIGAQVSLGVALATGCAGLLTGRLVFPLDLGTWAALLFQAAMLVAAIGSYYLGLMRLGASRTSLLDTGQPLFAVAAGALLLHERLVPVQLLGVVIVATSVAFSSLVAQRGAALPLAERP